MRASSEPSTVLRSFQGANTACRSVTVCGAVRASRSASSFKCGVLALPRRSRLQNGRQPSHTHCVYIFCVSFSRSSYSVRVLARMHVRCSQLLFFTPPRKRVASHRKCDDPSVRHVSSGRKRCVREKLSFFTICCCFCFLLTFSLVFWVVHIFWYCLPSPNEHRLSPRFYVTFISHILSNTLSCCWNAVFYVAYVVHETELVYVETIAFVIVDLVFFLYTLTNRHRPQLRKDFKKKEAKSIFRTIWSLHLKQRRLFWKRTATLFCVCRKMWNTSPITCVHLFLTS